MGSLQYFQIEKCRNTNGNTNKPSLRPKEEKKKYILIQSYQWQIGCVCFYKHDYYISVY